MGAEGRGAEGVSIPTQVNVQQKNTSLGPRFSFQIVSQEQQLGLKATISELIHSR